LHQNAFSGRVPPGPAGGAYSAPHADPLAGFILWAGAGKGKRREGIKGREGKRGGERGGGKEGREKERKEERDRPNKKAGYGPEFSTLSLPVTIGNYTVAQLK